MRQHEMALDFAHIVAGWKRFLALWAALAVGCGAVLAGIGIYQRRELYGGDAKALIGLSLREEALPGDEVDPAEERAADDLAKKAGITRLQSPTLIARALTNLGLGLGQLDRIRSGISVQDVLSDEDYEKIMIYRALLSKNSLSLEAAQQATRVRVSAGRFLVSLNYRKTNLSRAEAVQLLDEILRCYRESFEAENNELALPEGIAAEAPAGYAESVRFYTEQLDALRNWLRNRVFTEATGELPEQLTESFASWQSRHPELLAGLFRSRTTGYTMLDLLEETELLMRTDLCGAAGFIQMTPVFAGDVSAELEKTKARLDAEENGQQLLQSRYSALEETLKTYEREPSIHYLAVDGQAGSGTRDAYDRMVLEMTALQAQMAEQSAMIREDQKLISRLEAAENASPEALDRANEMLNAVKAKYRALTDRLTVTAKEYQGEAVRPNTVEVLVPATASGTGMISSQWRRTILILEAVLLIAWLGAGIGYGLKQSVQDEKKRPTEEDC